MCADHLDLIFARRPVFPLQRFLNSSAMPCVVNDQSNVAGLASSDVSQSSKPIDDLGTCGLLIAKADDVRLGDLQLLYQESFKRIRIPDGCFEILKLVRRIFVDANNETEDRGLSLYSVLESEGL
jgi:hypothetical protein